MLCPCCNNMFSRHGICMQISSNRCIDRFRTTGCENKFIPAACEYSGKYIQGSFLLFFGIVPKAVQRSGIAEPVLGRKLLANKGDYFRKRLCSRTIIKVNQLIFLLTRLVPNQIIPYHLRILQVQVLLLPAKTQLPAQDCGLYRD